MQYYLLFLYKPNNLLHRVLVKSLLLARKKKKPHNWVQGQKKEKEVQNVLESIWNSSPNPGEKDHQVSPRPET